jgi:transposase
MIPIPTGVRVWLATGYTDMRKGFPGLSLQVQEVLRRDPLGGHLFCFRGRRSDLLKVIWHDGQGACCSQNGWSEEDFCGHRLPTGR